MSELKPCPFCGGEAKLIQKTQGLGNSPMRIINQYVVGCEKCQVYVQYMKSGDRYLIGFVDGMRLARSIVDGSIDEPEYVYPSEGMSDD